MKKTFFLSLTAVLLLLTACTQDVMEKLESNTYDSSLSLSYWNNEMKENSELWQQAWPYCKANPIKVNCSNVNETWEGANLRPAVVVVVPRGGLARRIIRNRLLINE